MMVRLKLFVTPAGMVHFDVSVFKKDAFAVKISLIVCTYSVYSSELRYIISMVVIDLQKSWKSRKASISLLLLEETVIGIVPTSSNISSCSFSGSVKNISVSTRIAESRPGKACHTHQQCAPVALL